jgi:hypothetical protein
MRRLKHDQFSYSAAVSTSYIDEQDEWKAPMYSQVNILSISEYNLYRIDESLYGHSFQNKSKKRMSNWFLLKICE